MAMVRLNRMRMDYPERFQAMIDAYNAGSLNAEEFFTQLVAFTESLTEEEQRGVGEQLNEEELALFDLLTKPHIDMSARDREKVKATAGSAGRAQGGEIGARLAQAPAGPTRSAGDHREAAGPRPAEDLHSGTLRPEGLRRVPTRL